MKPSAFNTILPLSPRLSVIYNAYTEKYLFFNPATFRVEEALTAGSDAKTAKTLEAGGFIVPDETDEVERVKQRQQKIDLNDDLLGITINPTVNCNFRCWYCYESHHKSRMSKATVGKIEKFIAAQAPRFRNVSLSFFGGEPLIYFKSVMRPIIAFANETCEKTGTRLMVDMTSNAYLLTPEIADFLAANHFRTIQITLDGGKTHHDKTRFLANGTGSYTRIVRNIKMMAERGIYVIMRINYTKDNIESVKSIPDSFRDLSAETGRNIRVSMHQVWQDSSELTQQVDEAIRGFEAVGMTISRNLFANVSNSCYADKKNQLVVNYNGDIFKCTAVDFEKEQRDGYLDDTGEVVWENDSLARRLDSKFKNPPCLSCRLLPICNGGCSQQALSHAGTDYCVMNFDDTAKDRAVLDKIRFNALYNADWAAQCFKNQTK